MGLNTVCAYLFWNMHEPRPGQFVWSGQADAAEFCRIAQQEGLWVILRPGPYSCAEWEMGGFPWWLLKDDSIQLRTRHERYLTAVSRYLKEVGRVLGPLQASKGGPILMAQVENEYGFYGKDAEYMGALRQGLISAGFDVPLFACNPRQHLKDGYRSDLFPVVNFGSDPAGSFKALREILPKGPLMCGEFYPGWFDTWGAPHHTGNTDTYLRDLDYMLKQGASFSIYMAHGGTTFGLWAGADRPFKPDTSSYDYDAPISEAGWTTDKFFKTRALFAKHLLPGESIPEPPAPNPVIAIPGIQFNEIAPVFDNLPEPIPSDVARTMEVYDQGYGCILYRTELTAGPAGTLEAASIRDFGYVFLDGHPIGITDRRSGKFKVPVPARAKAAALDILVEPMGRVNFGAEVHDRKGIHGPVTFTGTNANPAQLTNWKVYSLPLDSNHLATLRFSRESPASPAHSPSPAFYRGSFSLEKTGDSFLDLRSWGKGVVWINGRCLGRFWNIGPTQTAYVPGPWLKPGRNEIIILDHLGPQKAAVAGLVKPILDQLRPELDFARARRPEVKTALHPDYIVCKGEFEPGVEARVITFPKPATGRFFALESLNAHDGKPYAAVAELVLLDTAGKPLTMDSLRVAYVDSEERTREDGTAENTIDGQTANFWHTEWGSASPNHPHQLVLDLGEPRTIGGFRFVPRQGDRNVGGRIKAFQIYVGNELIRQP
jgi:beta-galactosidase